MNGRYKPSPLRVENSNILMLVHVEMEKLRAEIYAPILSKYGKIKQGGPFDYSKYEALDPYDRCFDNAMETATNYGLRYMEGLLLFTVEGGGTMCLAHGWCEDPQGQIVDATCAKNQNHPSIAYYGVPIKLSYSERWNDVVGYYGCLDGDQYGRPIGVHHDPASEWLDVVQTVATV